MTRSIPVAIAALFIMSCTSAVTQSQAERSTSLDGHQSDKLEAPSATSTNGDDSIESDETGSDAAESEKPEDTIIVTEIDASASTSETTASSRPATAAPSAPSRPATAAPAAASDVSPSTEASTGSSSTGSADSSSSPDETSDDTASSARQLRTANVLEILGSRAASVLRELQASSSGNAGSTVSSAPPSTESTTSTVSVTSATSSSTAPAPAEETATPRQPRTSAEVYRAVEQLEGLRGWTVVPFAHFQREDRHVVVAWPAINSSGRLVDATVVGVCLEEGDTGELEECGRRWVVRDRADSRAALVNALGGSDYRVMTASPGAELDDLGPRVSELGTAFSRAISNGNRSQARSAAIEFTRLLPVSEVAFDNQVAQLLYMASSYNGRLEHAGTVRNGDSATITFHVYRSILRVRTIRATAREIGDTGRWHIVSYQ